MKITVEDLGDRQVRLTIEVDEERVEKAMRGVARRLSKEYKFPGFRRGRAPYNLILSRFGREALLNEAVDDLGQRVYAEAVESEALEPYDMGVLEEMQLDPLVLTLRVPLRPVVDLGDYRALRVEPPEVIVDEEEVAAELERLRQANAYLEPADDRPAQLGDVVTVDVEAVVEDEILVQEEGFVTLLDVEDTTFEAGFAEQVVGMEAGEEKQFALALSDDWGTDMAGQEATFNVTLHEIRNRILPDLDDDLARTVGDFDSMEELRRDIEGQFEEKAQKEADEAYVEQALDALVAQASMEYPPDLVEDEIDRLLDDLERRLDAQRMDLDQYLELSGQTEEEMREYVRPRAERLAKSNLALSELAREEGLDLDRQEIDAQISALSAPWGEQAERVHEMYSSVEGMRAVVNQLMADKAVQRLLAITRGEAPPLEEEIPDEEAAEASAVDQGDDVEAQTDEEEASDVEATLSPETEDSE